MQKEDIKDSNLSTSSSDKLIRENNLNQLFEYIVKSDFEKIKELIRRYPGLLLLSGDVRDLSGRLFKQITAFQYAIWAKDYLIWEIIEKYLELPEQKHQYLGLKGIFEKHGGYSYKNLIESLKKLVSSSEEANAAAKQLWLLPSFKLLSLATYYKAGVSLSTNKQELKITHSWEPGSHEYDHKKFSSIETKLSDSELITYNPFSKIKITLFLEHIPMVITSLGSMDEESSNSYGFLQSQSKVYFAANYITPTELEAVQFKIMQLKKTSDFKEYKSTQISYPNRLLQYIVEGNEIKAEKLIAANPDILLKAGSVVDLSGRVFKKITAFQYALWAWDWHMRRMIKKYLPPAEQQYQFGEWINNGTEHGQFFCLEPLIEMLEQYNNLIRYHKDDKLGEIKDLWCRIGKTQLTLPVHILNEYCRKDILLCDPQRTFVEKHLPRTRECSPIKVDCLSTIYQEKLGDGIALLSGGILGIYPLHLTMSYKLDDIKNVSLDLRMISLALMKLYCIRLQQLVALPSDFLLLALDFLFAVFDETQLLPPATVKVIGEYVNSCSFFNDKNENLADKNFSEITIQEDRYSTTSIF